MGSPRKFVNVKGTRVNASLLIIFPLPVPAKASQ